jgi:glucose-1-phosphate adenylyltransferase
VMKKIIALILGGGQGKRLFPLTLYRSKPAVPIGGKYRIIDIPISNCLHSNLKNIFVLTQFNSESLNNHINNTYRFDFFSRAFVRILAAEQTSENIVWFQGTADAVRRNLNHLELKGDEEIIILSGDQLYEMDYMELIHFHRKNRADMTVSVIPIREEEAKEFGILKLGSGDRITGFKEKPKHLSELKGFKYTKKRPALDRMISRSSYLASMGVYVFNAKVLRKALDNNDADFGHEVIPHSINKYRSFAYIFDGYWKDIGTIKSFYDVNIDLAAYKPHFSFFYKGEVFTRPRFLPPVRIAGCKIDHSLLTEGCIISDSDISGSIIGLRTIVGKGSKIDRTVVMGADYYEDRDGEKSVPIGIGEGSSIDRAIVDKNARIGKGVVIKNSKNIKHADGENYFIRDGIVIVPKNAVLKDGTVI